MAITSPTRAHAEYAAAFNAGNLDALCDMYEADAIFVPSSGQMPIRGIDGIRAALVSYLAMKGTMTIETVFAHENGEIALLRSRWRITATSPDGVSLEVDGSSVEVARRQPDGKWRLIIDHPTGAN